MHMNDRLHVLPRAMWSWKVTVWPKKNCTIEVQYVGGRKATTAWKNTLPPMSTDTELPLALDKNTKRKKKNTSLQNHMTNTRWHPPKVKQLSRMKSCARSSRTMFLSSQKIKHDTNLYKTLYTELIQNVRMLVLLIKARKFRWGKGTHTNPRFIVST